jgi:DNA-binding transcriptional regulator YdaS (Cro superfamily)
MKAIDLAIKEFGNASKLAEALGVTTQAVCFWRDGLRQVSAEVALLIDIKSNGIITCESLRTDIDWG